MLNPPGKKMLVVALNTNDYILLLFGILLAGLLVALSYLGGEAVQINMGMPLAVTGVFQGMLLFFLLAGDVLVRYRVRAVSTRPAGESA